MSKLEPEECLIKAAIKIQASSSAYKNISRSSKVHTLEYYIVLTNIAIFFQKPLVSFNFYGSDGKTTSA